MSRLKTASSIEDHDTVKRWWNDMANWFVLLLFITPLLFERNVVDPVTTIRYLFVSIFIFVFVLKFFVFIKQRNSVSLARLTKIVFILYLCYSLWNLITLFFALNASVATYEFVRSLLNIVILFLTTVIVTYHTSKILILYKAIVIGSIIQSTAGLLQFYHSDLINIPAAVNPAGFMVHRNLFGSAQALVLGYVLYVLYKGTRLWKVIGSLAVAGIVISVLISGTRSAWLATITGIVTAGSLLLIFLPLNRKKISAWLAGGTLGIIVIVVMFLKINHDTSFVNATSNKAQSIVNSLWNNAASTGRFALWNKSIRLIAEHPVVGVGLGNWSIAVWLYGVEGTSWGYGEQVPSRPHNVYLQVASESGIPGALFFIGAMVVLLFAGMKTIIRSNDTSSRVLCICMISGIVAFATDNMFSFSTERIEHSLYITLMTGIILGLHNLTEHKRGSEMRLRSGLVVFILYLVGINIMLGYKKYLFEKYAGAAKILFSQKHYQDVVSEVENGKTLFVTIDTNGDPIEMISGLAYLELGNYESALNEMLTALHYHPNSPRIYTAIGKAYAGLQRYDKAVECYERALSLAPNFDVVLINLAYVYFELHNYQACIKIINRVSSIHKSGLDPLLVEATKKLRTESEILQNLPNHVR